MNLNTVFHIITLLLIVNSVYSHILIRELNSKKDFLEDVLLKEVSSSKELTKIVQQEDVKINNLYKLYTLLNEKIDLSAQLNNVDKED